MYKILNRPFNTPFIGLMLMAPCYIKLLSNLQTFLQMPLRFIEQSRYPSVEELRRKHNCPIAALGDSDIEICFLHYSSMQLAEEKWDSRIKRIDWNNLYVKFDCGKDYATKDLVTDFLKLPFSNKLVFGKDDFAFTEVFTCNNYSSHSLIQFRNCLEVFNPFNWVCNDPNFKNGIDKFICWCASKYL